MSLPITSNTIPLQTTPPQVVNPPSVKRSRATEAFIKFSYFVKTVLNVITTMLTVIVGTILWVLLGQWIVRVGQWIQESSNKKKIRSLVTELQSVEDPDKALGIMKEISALGNSSWTHFTHLKPKEMPWNSLEGESHCANFHLGQLLIDYSRGYSGTLFEATPTQSLEPNKSLADLVPRSSFEELLIQRADRNSNAAQWESPPDSDSDYDNDTLLTQIEKIFSERLEITEWSKEERAQLYSMLSQAGSASSVAHFEKFIGEGISFNSEGNPVKFSVDLRAKTINHKTYRDLRLPANMVEAPFALIECEDIWNLSSPNNPKWSFRWSIKEMLPLQEETAAISDSGSPNTDSFE